MRAAAVALVLIVGAAVVLWFGNMLNSWVLGGLMGGLAAILLSIPISLTLFSYLARRHDERLKAVEQEEVILARSYDYAYIADAEAEEEVDQVYEAEAYMLPEEAEEEWPAERPLRRPASRNLPAPAAYRSLAPVAQSLASSPAPASYQRALNQPPLTRQQAKASPADGGKGMTAQRPLPDRRVYYPGFPGYTGNSMRALHQSAALRAARLEAVQQQNDVEVLPNTSHLKRLPTARPTRNLPQQPARASRQLQRQMPDQNRTRRTVDSFPVQPAQQGMGRQSIEPRTEPINGNANNPYPQTGPVRQQPNTGQMLRNVRFGEQYGNPEINTGSLRHPLVRRPPYMYEDDPLRQELAQRIDPPAVRRSSLYADAEEYYEE